ncbi:hypothetical protein TIFTF001_025153 [Ficus carica]|uniref:Uncharacterized protein n=1 Tax=Ficus carica TaxID=3494 RepID=A0AA88DFC0_FICCA|nr:hypothetical protein TIFTF001_025153 [Ficus carica]
MNTANEHSMEILASLDFFQAVIDSIQDHQEENKKRLDHQKDCLSQFLNLRSENRLLREIFEINLLELGFESFSKFDEGYKLNQSDEGTFIFKEIKATAIDVGTKLSHFLVEYFLMIWLAEWTVIESKIQAVKDVIKLESLEENSVIIDMFISVMEFISKEMRRCKKKRGAKKDVIQKANVSPDRVLLLVVEKYTRQLLASKTGNIHSYMNKLEVESASTSDRDPRKKKLKEKLNM